MSDIVRMSTGKQDLDLEVVEGTEEEKGVDISNLRAKTGLVTLDPAFMNTASTMSAITFLDGERGILRYRGIPIEGWARRAPSARPRICSSTGTSPPATSRPGGNTC